MSQVDGYKHLRARPDNWRKQLWFKDRNMNVWHLVSVMLANGETPEETAKCRGMPLEAVLEALDYYGKHKDTVRADVEEEGLRLRQAGLL